VAEESLVGGDADGGVFDLAAGGLAFELPGQFADLGDGLGGDGFAEGGQPAGGVDGDAAADGGGPGAQELFGFALGAQAQVFIPVEFQCGGQVVDLGQGEVFGADTGFGVGGVEDLVFEDAFGAGDHGGGIGGDIGQFG
jgi:hypothetical protein